MKILFVCTGNTCRSPMAEGIFNNKYAGNGASCKSAGLAAVSGIPPAEHAIAACLAINIDISGYRSTGIEDVNINDFDLFVVMTPHHEATLKLLSVPADKIRLLGFGIPDPYGGSYEDYIECRDKISEALSKFVQDEKL